MFFDYAILERPVIFFMYDMEEYENDLRGFYIPVDSLPGPIAADEQELVEMITNPIKVDYGEFNGKYNEFNDGNASERLVKRIMK